ncbi:MAG: ABC transporter permease [Acidobacteriota bacterium]
MSGYLLRRALSSVPTLFLVMGVTFLLLQSLPGDPAELRAAGLEARSADRAAVEHLRQQFGLDRALPVQALDWARRCLRFDFGVSFSDGSPVGAKVARALWATAVLNGSALLLLLTFSIGGGMALAAWKQTWLGRPAMRLLAGVAAVPSAWGALLLQRLLAVDLGWLPLEGGGPAGGGAGSGWLNPSLHFLALPALAVAYRGTALYTLLARQAIAQALESDHVLAAQARGLPRRLLYLRHALRTAARSLIATSAPMARALVAGNVVVETVFGWPGAGRLLVDALLQRDYPVLLALTWVSILFTLVWMVATDLVLGMADPRVRLHTAAEGQG